MGTAGDRQDPIPKGPYQGQKTETHKDRIMGLHQSALVLWRGSHSGLRGHGCNNVSSPDSPGLLSLFPLCQVRPAILPPQAAFGTQ